MLSDIGRPQGRAPSRVEPNTAQVRKRSFLFLGMAVVLVTVLGAVRSVLEIWTAPPEAPLETEIVEAIDMPRGKDNAAVPESAPIEEGTRLDVRRVLE